MAVQLCSSRVAPVFLIVLCLLLYWTAPCSCRISSLNDKYSQWQTLSFVKTSSLSPHNIVKRETKSSKMTPNKIFIDTSYLKGTEKSNQAFVHWIGKETSEKVIVLTCQFNFSSETSYVIQSQLWRSDDYGSTFDMVDVGKGAKISYFYTFATNSQKLLFTDVRAKKIYLTTDEAITFTMVSVPVEPDMIIPHPSNDSKILLYSISHRKLYVSIDSGNKWTLFAEEVLPRIFWGTDDFDKGQDIVHMETEGASSDTALYKACIVPSCTQESKDGEILGPFVAGSLLVHKEYIFVQKSKLDGSGSTLMTSYKRQPFKKAYFPDNVKTNDFIMLNLDDGQVFVAVTRESSVNLYLSDVTGHYFVLSFADVYHAIHPYWLEIDFHEVKGMNWTFLVNKRAPSIPNGVQSYISFDKGGNWRPIPTSKNLKKEMCKDEDCYLQLNINRSPLITSAISSKNAPGIIMAHGTLVSAKHPQQPMALFTSRDGGWTWTKAPFQGIHNLNILDQGSILTAVPDGLFSKNRSKVLYFSCDEGATWKENVFDNYGFLVNGVLSEPEILTLTEMLFGHEGSKKPWVLMKLNFSQVLKEKCEAEDYESWFPEDYNDESQNNCTMGRLVEYKRRKQNANCYNGQELIPRVISNQNCECTREDYECEFGYEEEGGNKCSMAKWYHVGDLPVVCSQGEDVDITQGYRKVSADVCLEKEEEKEKFGKVKAKCPFSKPSGLSISTHSLNVPVGKEITFYLTQSGGSLDDTSYTWDFGDATDPQVRKNFDKARTLKYTYTKSGHFNVTVEAKNDKGSSSGYLNLHVQTRLNELSIISPLAGKTGIPTMMNVAVSSQTQPFQENSDHVHFIWKFGDEDDKSHPLLTWNHSVSHIYKKKGMYTLSVEAVNSVGSLYRQYQMHIFNDAEILVLGFEGSVMVNLSNPVISILLLQRLRYQLSDDLGLRLSRLETTSAPHLLSSALLFIYPSDDPEEEKIEKIKQRVVDLVNGGNFGFSLLGKRAQGGMMIKVSSAMPYTPEPAPDEPKGDHHKGPNMKAIFIGVPILILAVVISIGLLCYCRKKHRSAQQYNMLHMQDDSDALLDDEDDPPLDLNIEFRGRDNYRDDPVLDSGGSQLVMQDNMENC